MGAPYFQLLQEMLSWREPYPYPQNLLRNVAKSGCPTNYTYIPDIGTYLYEYIYDTHGQRHIERDIDTDIDITRSMVFVLLLRHKNIYRKGPIKGTVQRDGRGGII